MKKLVFAVTNDLTYDQRMDRICSTLVKEGFDVLLVGRKKRYSAELVEKIYEQKRLNCYFEKGKSFYIEYNLRLFFYLLGLKFDVVCAIDLDTIVPCFIAGRIKRKKVVYDAHEYFTEVIELVKRPVIQGFWRRIEAFFVPRCEQAYTVSESIKNIFDEKYGTNFKVIRNIAVLEEYTLVKKPEKYMIYIGAVNEGRGLEQLIKAMKYIDLELYICGDGDILNNLIALSSKLGLEKKVKFLGYVKPDQLKELTRNAYLGYLLLDRLSESYYYSLANKFFDYIHAGIPQVTIDFPEYRIINKQYKVAELIALKEEEIVKAVNKLLYDKEYYNMLVENTRKATLRYNWQTESQELVDIYKAI